MTKQGQRISASVSILIFFPFLLLKKKPLTLFRFFSGVSKFTINLHTQRVIL